MPWTGKQQRRAILNKYNASHMSWGGGGFDRSRPEYFDELTVEQQKALELPSHHSRRAGFLVEAEEAKSKL
jgi:hypothetical protein